jgi:hypothetical protein
MNYRIALIFLYPSRDFLVSMQLKAPVQFDSICPKIKEDPQILPLERLALPCLPALMGKNGFANGGYQVTEHH